MDDQVKRHEKAETSLC